MKEVLRANGYPDKVVQRSVHHHSKPREMDERTEDKLFIPYVCGLTEEILSICFKLNIIPIFIKQMSLRNILTRVKQPQSPEDIKGVTYTVPCSSYSAIYIVEAGKTMISWNQASVLEREANRY